MNNKFEDFTGRTFNKLTGIRFIGPSKDGRVWEWQCECGRITNVSGPRVKRGAIKTCGCSKKVIKPHLKRYSRGGIYKRIYKIWQGMRQRCIQTNDPYTAKNYRDRGISICERWNVFENFLEDMGFPPTDKHSIDRINNDGNYEKENCKWSTQKEQNKNRRNNLYIEYNGETLSLIDLVEKYSTQSWACVYQRYTKLKWNIHDALTAPIQERYSKRTVEDK